jgi:ADP-ribose pyrophosphatase
MWKKLKSKILYKNSYFSLRSDRCQTEDGRIVENYYVVDFPDWVHVVAFTESKELIIVEQYRYPGEGLFLELPGGSTSPQRDEEPLVAARRELLEETGYSTSEWTYLGSQYPNPALQGNKAHVFLAENCKKTADQSLDEFEKISVKKMTVDMFLEVLKKDVKCHAIMMGAIFLYLNITNQIAKIRQ